MNSKIKKNNKKHKYIFVVGGVMSGVGKGIATASLGNILSSMGHGINLVKVDPYLNVDAGTMNPTEHGEVFVLNCGLETDQDMGNYERFLNIDASKYSYMTSGMIYRDVINKERNLGYGGKCVEAIPNIRDEIISRFKKSAKESGADISIIEIGGTIGDYQNIMFFEAARVLKVLEPDNVIFIMVSYLPIPGTLGEMKTRPTQNAVRQLNSYGIQADFIIARSHIALDQKRKEKLAVTCNLPANHIISAPDISSVYDVPINFDKDHIGEIVAQSLKLNKKKTNLIKWKNFVKSRQLANKVVKIAVVGKYFDTGDFVLSDSYVSVIEAIKYSCFKMGLSPQLTWINSKTYDNDLTKVKELKQYQGIIVPGGFGESGIEGKIAVIKFAREHKIPYLGLCYGMQLLVIEYARNVVGILDAHTAEISKTSKNLVIDIMPDQKKKLLEKKYGASMRLGTYPAIIRKNTIAFDAYKKTEITERHRHRYEVNPDYVVKLEEAGLIFSATSPDGNLMEIAELPKEKHPFMLGTQFHPEFKARPLDPHPLFDAFIKTIKEKND
jgi:CTP synthase